MWREQSGESLLCNWPQFVHTWIYVTIQKRIHNNNHMEVPDELLQVTFLHLPPKTALGVVGLVCRRWHACVESAFFLRQLCAACGFDVDAASPPPSAEAAWSWKEYFKQQGGFLFVTRLLSLIKLKIHCSSRMGRVPCTPSPTLGRQAHGHSRTSSFPPPPKQRIPPHLLNNRNRRTAVDGRSS